MNRLSSIDATRGLVMLLMLVDHAREFFFFHAQVSDPVNIDTTSPSLFFTRFAAHLCAPIFVGLTGVSAWLHYNKNQNLKITSEFLFKRGLILVLLELTVVSLAWSFSFPRTTIFLQVIWAIGLSMIALSGLIYLPRKYLIGIGALIVLGHNLLNPITFSADEFGHTLWAIIHDRGYIYLSETLKIRTSYPVLPWIGLMALGFTLGPVFKESSGERKKYFWKMGAVFLIGFIILRTINGYGEPLPWSHYESGIKTLMSYLNLTKYPPSADFLLLTCSVGLFIMGVFETSLGRLSRFLTTFGSVPMFYYIFHIYVLNIIHTCCKFIWGVDSDGNFGVSEVGYIWMISASLVPFFWVASKWYGKIKKKYPKSLLRYI